MKKEQIVDFTRRISQANRSGLVVVMYDIFFTYLDDARAAYDAADWDAYKEALRRAQRAIDELISALNFSYDMAKNLYSIYVFCRDSKIAVFCRHGCQDHSGANCEQCQHHKQDRCHQTQPGDSYLTASKAAKQQDQKQQ